MLLRILVALGMTAFCVFEGFSAASVPTDGGDFYFPFEYLLVPVLLWGGLNPSGLISWPIASLMLLLSGHWILGWVPVGLVVINLIGNRMAKEGRAG